MIWLVVLLCISGAVLFAVAFAIIWGLCNYEKFPQSDIKKKIAVIIPARNEERVIGNIIKSIRAQNYPQNLVTIFVFANNCTDRTVEIVRELGEKVYEINDPAVNTAGLGLSAGFAKIKEEYGDFLQFDGYLKVDADNTFDVNYLSKLNDAFVKYPDGILTTYRGNQNWNDGWRASLTCMLMTQSMLAFRFMSGLRIGSIVTGPGCLLSANIIEKCGGFLWTVVGDDIDLSTWAIKNKIKPRIVMDAIFYDEQPNSLRTIFNQRLRWEKSKNRIFFRRWFAMIKRIFSRVSLLALFMTIGLFPIGLTTVVCTTGFAVYGFVMYLLSAQLSYIYMFIVAPIVLNLVLGWFMAIITFIIERRRIAKIKFFKKLLYIFVSPLSFAISNLCDFFRLFIKVKWKPIPHGLTKSNIPI